VVQLAFYNGGDMATNIKPRPQSSMGRSVRQSITIPGPLAAEVRRVAKERHLTVSRAVIALAERGVQAEREAKDNLRSAYQKFLREREPEKKGQAGKDLIRAIFGADAIAEDSIL
jgi:predicted DNA-binding ribbon-helix-helix protein